MNIGFIGLGKMGAAIAGNLLRSGHHLTVFNRTQSRAAPLLAAGAHYATTVASACQSEVVITCLSDDDAVTAVAFGEAGILASLAPKSSIHLSFSTISPALGQRLALAHREARQDFLAAPVFGRPEAAAAARLIIVVGGDAKLIERCQPLLDALGQRTLSVGDQPTAALWVKLAGNFLLLAAVEGLRESIAFLNAAGADAEECLRVLTSTIFAAPVYQNYARLLLQTVHTPGFQLGLALKDITLVGEASAKAGLTLPLAELLRTELERAVAQGWKEQDLSVLARLNSFERNP